MEVRYSHMDQSKLQNKIYIFNYESEFSTDNKDSRLEIVKYVLLDFY